MKKLELIALAASGATLLACDGAPKPLSVDVDRAPPARSAPPAQDTTFGFTGSFDASTGQVTFDRDGEVGTSGGGILPAGGSNAWDQVQVTATAPAVAWDAVNHLLLFNVVLDVQNGPPCERYAVNIETASDPSISLFTADAFAQPGAYDMCMFGHPGNQTFGAQVFANPGAAPPPVTLPTQTMALSNPGDLNFSFFASVRCMPHDLAVAFTDVDSDDAYTEGTDILIARWEDTNLNCTCDAGDTVHTNMYPLDASGLVHGTFLSPGPHVIDATVVHLPGFACVGTNGPWEHLFLKDSTSAEGYQETDNGALLDPGGSVFANSVDDLAGVLFEGSQDTFFLGITALQAVSTGDTPPAPPAPPDAIDTDHVDVIFP